MEISCFSSVLNEVSRALTFTNIYYIFVGLVSDLGFNKKRFYQLFCCFPKVSAGDTMAGFTVTQLMMGDFISAFFCNLHGSEG